MSRAAASPARDNRRLVLWITAGVLIVAAIIAVALASRVPKAATNAAPVAPAKLAVGQPAPDFSVKTNSGTFALPDVSTPVFLEVFATWCPHCQRETVVMNDLAKKYAGKVAFVGVSGSPYAIDGTTAETQDDVNAFAQRFNLNYPVAFDGDLGVARKYLQSGFPTFVLISKDKKIAYLADGEISEATIKAQLDKTL